MGSYITAISFRSPSVTATTEHPSFPAAHVTSITRPHRVYRSTAAAGTAQALVFDFGATVAVPALVIDRTNAGSVIIEAHGSDSWGTPSYGATVAVGQDTLDGRYKLFHDLRTQWPTTGFRYCRIRPAGTATTYGGTAWEVGSVAFAGTVATWAENMGFPYRRTPLQEVDEGRLLGGGAQPAAIGNRYCRITLSTNNVTEATMRTTLDEFVGAGRHVPLLFFPNQGSDAEVYICHRVGEVSVDRGGPGMLSVAAIALEEYV